MRRARPPGRAFYTYIPKIERINCHQGGDELELLLEEDELRLLLLELDELLPLELEALRLPDWLGI